MTVTTQPAHEGCAMRTMRARGGLDRPRQVGSCGDTELPKHKPLLPTCPGILPRRGAGTGPATPTPMGMEGSASPENTSLPMWPLTASIADLSRTTYFTTAIDGYAYSPNTFIWGPTSKISPRGTSETGLPAENAAEDQN